MVVDGCRSETVWSGSRTVGSYVF